MNLQIESPRRCALAIAHPGHEIRVFAWLEANRPLTYVLTDGSGQKGRPRLNSSHKLLSSAGAAIGSIFGVASDRQVYSDVLAGNGERYLRLADQLAREWARQEIDVVLADACEGTIMAHDLWRGVVDRAVALASDMRGLPIANLGFSLEADPRELPFDAESIHSRVTIGDAIWERKIRAAENYDGLQAEVQRAFADWGRGAFRYETILVQPATYNTVDWSDKPPYERHGEHQVSAGVYERVVRYREHVRPILQALKLGGASQAKAA